MAKFNPKEVKIVKGIVNFLNKKFGDGSKDFWAYHPRGKDSNYVEMWTIFTSNGLLYMDYIKNKEDSKLYKKVQKKKKKLNFILVYQHRVTKEIIKSRDSKTKGIFVS